MGGAVVKSLRVLIADDEAIIRMGLRTMLEEMGHQVVGMAADGPSAVRLAAKEEPDLAILDIKMPDMDGLEVAEAITAKRRIPILMLTAYSDRELVERATKLAVLAYLVKPVKEADLGLAIELAMARFEEWQALEREAAGLKEALATREVVDRAKEILMQRDGLTEHEAFLSIQRRSRNSRRTMREVAEAILGVRHG
ncbi:MAG: response regulator [Anaerolineae bacterium]|nr:response regulator [Anaerolineae bacterium]